MYCRLKRIIDFVFSLACIVALSPILVFLALWIKLDSHGPIFFTQKRIGLHKKHFNIYKFRTMSMHTPKDTPTHLLADPNRYITKAGAFLRRSSLDELPQVLNILKGEMSIIGPRPALWNQYFFTHCLPASSWRLHYQMMFPRRIHPLQKRSVVCR